MAKAKSASKKTETKKADNSLAEARPVGQGKDPLAEGNTLANPTNSEAETHYQVKQRSEDVQAQSQIAGQDANERAEQHNAQSLPASDVPNSDEQEQAEVAEGRTEPGDEPAPAEEPEAPASDDAEEPTPAPEDKL